MKQAMIDIHNHFMFDVDDGAVDVEMTKALLKESLAQGVTTIFLTPHVNSSMSRASREIHKERFNTIARLAKDIGIQCELGAEIYIPFRLPELPFETYVMGSSKSLLVEFSPYAETPIIDHAYNLKHQGFDVIIAHVERYKYLDVNDLLELKSLGIYLQVNASSVIKAGHPEHAKRARQFIKLGLIDFVATDAHNTTSRPPRLLQAYQELVKFVGPEQAQAMVSDNAMQLLFKHT